MESTRGLLVIFRVSKAHKRQMIAGKGFGYGEVLLGGVVVIDVVEITRVVIAAQVRNNWWNA